MEDKIGLYKMSVDFGRSGDLEGLFLAKASHIKTLIDEEIEVYFGEVLGKHSDISCSFDEDDLKLISNDEAVVKVFQDHDISVGHNPFDCYTEDESGEEITILELIENKLKAS